MNPRFTKEFRALLLPWTVAAIAGAVSPVEASGDAPFLAGIYAFAFFTCIALLAAMSFGSEFQQGTLPLLLTQPFERSRLWNEKMRTMAVAVITLVIIHMVALVLVEAGGGRAVTLPTNQAEGGGLQGRVFLQDLDDGAGQENYPQGSILLAGALVLGAVCSSGFWTLIARSTIGGMVLTAAIQFFLVLFGAFAIGPELSFADSAVGRVIIVGGLLYSAIFLFLGRWRFETMELRNPAFGEGNRDSSATTAEHWQVDWLRCRPTGSFANLLRKELRLQKPVLMIAGVVSLCWWVTFALFLAQPTRQDVFEIIFNALSACVVLLVPLLAACLSVGEEAALGVRAWHLTLPISCLRQWAAKFSVALTVAALFGLGLPWLLAWLIESRMTVGLSALLNEDHGAGIWMALDMWGLLFVLGLWAASLLTNTVRAALATWAALTGIGLCIGAADWLARAWGGVETGLLSWGIAQFQWTPDQFFQLFDHWSLPFLWSLIAAIILTLLMQSLIQFRRPQVRKRTTVKYAVVLAVATFLLGFWCSDLLASRNRPFDSLGADLEGALSASWEANPNSESHRTVTVGELDAVRPLSAQTKKWLRNASLRITRAPAGIRPNFCQAEIEFPNGGEWTVRWQVGK